MLTLEQRPRTFREMAGQDLVKKALLHIVKDPENAPKTLLLAGDFGCGKTTAARIFARALNCLHPLPNGDACGECEFCKSDIQDSMFYSEYDSAIVGNVNSIKDLRNTFYFGYTKGYKVIVLDEIHLINKTAQGALLKVFEEPEPNVFFLLCTTDPEKLLPTITSRSFELKFSTVEAKNVVEHLKGILTKKKIEITPKIEENLQLIAQRSKGHMRNALMLLDSMMLLKEDFKDSVKSSEPIFLNLLNLSLNFNELVNSGKITRESLQLKINELIQELTTFPIAHLKQDYERLVNEIVKHIFMVAKVPNPSITGLVQKYINSFKLIDVIDDPVLIELFKNQVQFEIAMLVLSNKLRQLTP